MALVKSIYRSRINQEKQAHACENLNELNASAITLDNNEVVVLLNSNFSSLVQYLTSILVQNSVKLNCLVERIDYSTQNEILVSLKDENEQKNIVYSCDYVIVTIPLGYLKKNHVNIFAPELPGEKASAIDRLGFGCVNKIFIVFERPFLNEKQNRDDINFLEILWRDDLSFELNSNVKWNIKVIFFKVKLFSFTVLLAFLARDHLYSVPVIMGRHYLNVTHRSKKRTLS